MAHPTPPANEGPQQQRLFQSELRLILKVEFEGASHPLVRLGDLLPWDELDRELGANFRESGRPGVPTRLMVGLQLLKHTFDLSDTQVVRQWVENPYWQYFCGEVYFQTEPPVDPTTLGRWRRRMGSDGLEKLLGATLQAAKNAGLTLSVSLRQINVDTTVQEKAIAWPTQAKLMHRLGKKLVALARELGVDLSHTYTRKSKTALFEVNRYRRHPKLRAKWLRKLNTYLGAVKRDIERKIAEDVARQEKFRNLFALYERLTKKHPTAKEKLYSLHEPDVECIGKGKTRKPFEFGCKVSLATTSRDNWVVGALALHGNPYDGHTLNKALDQVERVTGQTVKGEVFVDKGYRGHDCTKQATIHVVKGIQKLDRTLKKWSKRRAAIEPIIGHLKNTGRLCRNFLKGKIGDELNVILCGCGQNIRKLLGILDSAPAPRPSG